MLPIGLQLFPGNEGESEVLLDANLEGSRRPGYPISYPMSRLSAEKWL
jgi:hypothetical protein